MTQVLPLNPFPHNDTFWRVWERSLLKTLWEKEKLLVQAISPFPTMFSTLSKTEIILVTFNFLSASAFNSDRSKILEWVNSLPNNAVHGQSKLRAFADHKINVTQKILFLEEGRKRLREWEIMLMPSIISFLFNVFKRLLSWNQLKSLLCAKELSCPWPLLTLWPV